MVSLTGDDAGTIRYADLGETAGTTNKQALSVSPDGRTLALFDAQRRGGLTLWRGPTGSVEFRPFPEGVRAVAERTAWNPSGTDLVALVRGGRPNHLIWIDPQGVEEPRILASDVSGQVTWCTEDQLIYQMPGNHDYMVLDVRTGESRPLLGDRTRGWMFNPACAPDGESVAFSYNRRGEGQDLWVVDVDGEGERRVVEDIPPIRSRPLQWSPNGEWIYFHTTESWPKWIYRVPAEGGTPEPVLRIPANSSWHHLSRDGRTLSWVEHVVAQDLPGSRVYKVYCRVVYGKLLPPSPVYLP